MFQQSNREAKTRMVNVESLTRSLYEGGTGSGPHKTVDDAVDAYNAKARAKMHPKKQSMRNPFVQCGEADHETCGNHMIPFQNVYMLKPKSQAATTSGAPGNSLTRAGVKCLKLN
jgi:hypothetical protein